MEAYSFFTDCITDSFFFNKHDTKIQLKQHKYIIKSNNKEIDYINQLLKLLFLKHTHTQKKIMQMIKKTNKKKGSIKLPPHGKSTPATPQMEALMAIVKKKEPSTVVVKISTSDVAGILDSAHLYISAT